MPNKQKQLERLQKFATKHAGHKVKIVDVGSRLSGAIGRVVGYSTSNLAIAVEVLDLNGNWSIVRSIESSSTFVLVVDVASIAGNGTWRTIDSLELIEERKVNHNPYNHKCKCGSKCRDMGNYSICSNLKCKSNKKMRMKLNTYTGHYDPKRIICKACSSKVLEYWSYRNGVGKFVCVKCKGESEYKLFDGLLLARYSIWADGAGVKECVCCEDGCFKVVEK